MVATKKKLPGDILKNDQRLKNLIRQYITCKKTTKLIRHIQKPLILFSLDRQYKKANRLKIKA